MRMSLPGGGDAPSSLTVGDWLRLRFRGHWTGWLAASGARTTKSSGDPPDQSGRCPHAMSRLPARAMPGRPSPHRGAGGAPTWPPNGAVLGRGRIFPYQKTLASPASHGNASRYSVCIYCAYCFYRLCILPSRRPSVYPGYYCPVECISIHRAAAPKHHL